MRSTSRKQEAITDAIIKITFDGIFRNLFDFANILYVFFQQAEENNRKAENRDSDIEA